MIPVAPKPCLCGKPAEVEHLNGNGPKQWRVRCTGRGVGVRSGAHRTKRGYCRQTDVVWRESEAAAIATWNQQFHSVTMVDDGTPKCPRCGLRLPCNSCLPAHPDGWARTEDRGTMAKSRFTGGEGR